MKKKKKGEKLIKKKVKVKVIKKKIKNVKVNKKVKNIKVKKENLKGIVHYCFRCKKIQSIKQKENDGEIMLNIVRNVKK